MRLRPTRSAANVQRTSLPNIVRARELPNSHASKTTAPHKLMPAAPPSPSPMPALRRNRSTSSAIPIPKSTPPRTLAKKGRPLAGRPSASATESGYQTRTAPRSTLNTPSIVNSLVLIGSLVLMRRPCLLLGAEHATRRRRVQRHPGPSAPARTTAACTASRPLPCAIWLRQLVPSAMTRASSAAARTAGSRSSSAIFIDSS